MTALWIRVGATLGLLAMTLGCGSTTQYMIPIDDRGTPIKDPPRKVGMGVIVNSDPWKDEETTVRGPLPVYESGGIVVEVVSSYRCFAWLLVIPLPWWASCSSPVKAPRRQIVHLKISNQSEAPWWPSGGKVRAFKDGRELDIRQSDAFPAELSPGESVIRGFDVAGWGELGWGYELDLSGVLGVARDPTPFQRYTTTKFGVWAE